MGKALIPLVSIASILIVGTYIHVRRSQTPIASPAVTPSIAASFTPVATSTPDPNAGWRTYSNPEVGFSFQYPSEWGEVNISKRKGDTGQAFGGHFSGNEKMTFGGQTPDFSVGTGAGFLSFFGCTKNTDTTYECSFARDKTRTISPSKVITTVGGTTALILSNIEIPQVLAPTTRGAYVNLSGTTYPGLAFQYVSIPDADAADFDALVSSVKIAKADPSTDETAQWQTYSSPSNYSFALKYPQGWNYQQVSGASTTPFGVTFANQELPFVNAPGANFPMYVAVTLVRIQGSVQDYASKDLAGKKASIVSSQAITACGNSGVQYESTWNGNLYMSAYIDGGTYMYLIEGISSEKDKNALLMNIFPPLVASLKVD